MIVVYGNEDGEVYIEKLSKAEVTRRLKEVYWGEQPKKLRGPVDLSADGGLYIIDGEEM